MIDKTAQQNALKAGLNLKEYCLLEFLQEAPDRLKLSGIAVNNTWCYELTISQVLEELPLLEIKERQLQGMLKALVDKGFLIKFKSRRGFCFSCAKNCGSKILDMQKIAGLDARHAENCTTKTASAGDINITTRTSNIFKNNNYSSNQEDEVSERSEPSINKYPIAPAGARVSVAEVRKAFAEAFLGRSLYLNFKLPANFDCNLLIQKMKESTFLREHQEFGLNWCIKNYQAIIQDYYKDFAHRKVEVDSSPGFEQRTYTDEELQGLYDTLDEIELEENAK